MTETDLHDLFEAADYTVAHMSTAKHRYLDPEIDWRDRLICIKGARGVGKTTLMLQHMRETFGIRSEKAVYASLDDLYFATHRLRDVAYWLVSHGYAHLFLEEVHHARDCLGSCMSKGSNQDEETDDWCLSAGVGRVGFRPN